MRQSGFGGIVRFGARGAWARTLVVCALASCALAAAMLGVIAYVEDRSPSTTVSRIGLPQAGAKVLAGDDWSERIRSDEFWRAGRPRREASEARPERGIQQTREPGKQQRSGSYRTVCVRLCDGSFFPISYQTSAGDLARDSAQCERSCAANSRLYITNNSEDALEDMVDLKGQAYSKLKTAGLFRKAYDESCKCKPHAWEEASLNRHRIYALDAQLKKGNKTVVAELEQRKSKARQLATAQKAEQIGRAHV